MIVWSHCEDHLNEAPNAALPTGAAFWDDRRRGRKELHAAIRPPHGASGGVGHVSGLHRLGRHGHPLSVRVKLWGTTAAVHPHFTDFRCIWAATLLQLLWRLSQEDHRNSSEQKHLPTTALTSSFSFLADVLQSFIFLSAGVTPASTWANEIMQVKLSTVESKFSLFTGRHSDFAGKLFILLNQ